MRALLNRLRIFELLEDRCVRASLSGSVFTDDSAILPRGTIQGALVWIDQNSNQMLDDGDLKSWTDASGEYHFQDLPIGNYEVRLRPPAGTFQTSPQHFFALQYDPSSQSYRIATLDPTSQSIIPASVSGFPDNRAGLIKTVDGEYFGAGHLLDTIVKFDIETGEETIYPKSSLQFVAGLAYDPTMDEIYTLAREYEEEPLRLFRINRIDAVVTAVSESIPDIPVATGTSSLAFDWVNRQVISFDNASDTFYKHDLQGNAERLGTFEIPTAFYNLSFDGTRFLMFYDRGGDTVVAEVDPYTAIATVVYSLSGSLSVNAGDITGNGTPQHVIVADNNTPAHADFVVGRLDLPTARLEMAGDSLRLTSTPKSIDLMVPLDNPGGMNQVCVGLGPTLLDLDTTSLNLAGGLLVQLTDNNDSVSLGDAPAGLLVDAGGGIDQAYITAPSSLDLSQPAAHLTGFEKVIFLGPSGSELTIDPHSIQQISGDQSLKVELRADQSIQLAGAMWRSETPKIEGGQRVHQIATDNSLLELTDQFGWHNPLQGLDVNFDGLTTPLDALRVVNFLNAHGTAGLSVEIAEHASAAYIDTSRDNRVTALDLLLVINHLNGVDI